MNIKGATASYSGNRTFIWHSDGNLSRNGGTSASGLYLVKTRTEDGETIIKRIVYIK
ncbi:hypothetical protein J7L68_03685 [bacterium]|nr:hypothetical protein [bacterium]